MIQPSTYRHFVVFLFGFFLNPFIHKQMSSPRLHAAHHEACDISNPRIARKVMMRWVRESHKDATKPPTFHWQNLHLAYSSVLAFYSMQKYIDNQLAKVEEVSSRTDRDYWSVGCPVWQCRWLHVGGSRKQRSCSKLIVQAMWQFSGSQLWASPIKLLTDRSRH
jgi:hypothetical protein